MAHSTIAVDSLSTSQMSFFESVPDATSNNDDEMSHSESVPDATSDNDDELPPRLPAAFYNKTTFVVPVPFHNFWNPNDCDWKTNVMGCPLMWPAELLDRGELDPHQAGGPMLVSVSGCELSFEEGKVHLDIQEIACSPVLFGGGHCYVTSPLLDMLAGLRIGKGPLMDTVGCQRPATQ